MHADSALPSNAKRQKTSTACREEHSDEATGEESADSADSGALLRATRTLQEPAIPKRRFKRSGELLKKLLT